ncbi:ABC transporter permease [Halobacterium salinarum]|uniref:ABC transporter permease n=1 Tax=Halobacterium salinarum TaxID=2242 RepID=UPI0025576E0A|nr:iron ABC transporter permease [Halobacterium salinarum]MDL0128358.1 iron ABC transporter permease [Halobacterium salinarum]MDL0134617.1 iron ABC transporter permease [Halobacterium salinarum]
MAARERLARIRSAVVSGDDDEPGLSLAVLAGAVAAFVSLPLAGLLVRASNYGLGHFLDVFADTSSLDVLVNSLSLVGLVTVGCVLVGVPLAVLTVQTDLPGRRAWTIIAALPLVVPSYIGAFTFVSAFGPRGDLAGALGVIGIERIPSIYGLHGAALVLILFTYPYVFLTTRAALLSFDGTLVEAARTLNHSRWQAFRRITVPQILPGVAAGGLLAALYALSDFGTPSIMRYEVYTQQIFVAQGSLGVPEGYPALLSIQLLAVVAVVLALESRIGDGDTAYVSRGASQPGRVSLGVWKWPALAFCTAIAVLSLGVPLGVLAWWFQRAGDAIFEFDPMIAWNSLKVAVAAAGAATVLALPVAGYAARSSSRLSMVSDRLTYVGYAIPGVVIALSLVFLSTEFVQSLVKTVPLLVFAYVVRFLPQAVGSVRSSVLQVDPKLTEAARTLGRSSTDAFRSVTLPLIAPGVAAGAALVFLTTMKELPATLMLRPIGFETLVSYIWLVRGAGSYGAAAVPALVLVGVSALSMVVILAQERYNG